MLTSSSPTLTCPVGRIEIGEGHPYSLFVGRGYVLIVTSGKVMPLDGDVPADGRFIPKPYSARHVANILHEMVGGSLWPSRRIVSRL
jgi:hypothetical protein